MKNYLFLITFAVIVTGFRFDNSTGHEVVWYTNYQSAVEISETEEKVIMMVFSGSDWCQPCIKLRKQIFENSKFLEFATKNLVLLEVDFPRSRKNRLSKDQLIHNESLAEQYNPQGIFPFIILLDNNKDILQRYSYKETSPDEFVKKIESIIQ